MKRSLVVRSRLAFVFAALASVAPLRAAIVTWDVSSLNLVTPATGGNDTNQGNLPVGVWFNMASGEAYVVTNEAGVPGKTDLANGRFQLQFNTYWSPASSNGLVQGDLGFNNFLGITTATPTAAAGSIRRLGLGEVVPVGSSFRASTYVEMAGLFGTWNDKGRGFAGLRFRNGSTLHFGYADITVLADGRLRLNGFAYNDVPNQTITTAYIGAPAPAAATNLAVQSVTATTVSLSWTDNASTETGFRIERRAADATAFTAVETIAANSTTYIDQGLAAATSYTYRVVATTGLDAAPTNEVVATTLAVTAPPAAPTQFAARADTPTSIVLSWVDNAVDETGTRIERAVGEGAFSLLATAAPGATGYRDTLLSPASLYRYRITVTNGLDAPVSDIASERTLSSRESVGADAAANVYTNVDGRGVVVGLWDFTGALTTHVEFQANGVSRVANRDGGTATTADANHTTHGAGVIAAAGIDPTAKGIAPAASVDTYLAVANSPLKDNTDMRAVGMEWPGQPGRIQIANASYGPIRGWNPVTGAVKWGFNAPKVSGAQPTVDPLFGAYSSYASDMDETTSTRPYLLVVRPAGNDRDDVPAAGELVYLSSEDFNTSTPSVYNPALHPPVDGGARGGYGIVSDGAAAKNTLTVGAIGGARRDATTGALLATGALTNFSNWGPTADGRIKPDLVAPGVNVRSTGYAANDAYTTLGGTSQAAPQVAGAAALLVQAWRDSGPQRYLLASTLKALLIHTADDLDVPGPDPRTGWGMVNVKAALDQLFLRTLNFTAEGAITVAQPALEFEVVAATAGEVRATLAWFDPAATASSSAVTTAKLVNDLDLTVTTADGATVFRPYVLPVALNSSADPAAAAVTGTNRVDSVEQVRFTASAGGVYRVRVTLNGALTNAEQRFSLAVKNARPASGAPQPTIARATGTSGVAELLGGGFELGAAISLRGPGGAVVTPTGVEVTPGKVRFRHEALTDGLWKVVVTQPDGRVAETIWPVGTAASGTTFAGWLGARFSEAQLADPKTTSASADADGDGYSMLAAYALGASSGSVPAANRPTSAVGAGNVLTVTFLRRQNMSDASVIVEATDSLTGTWTALPAGNYDTPVALGDGTERMTARDTVTIGSVPKRFLRLRVTQP